MSGTPKQRSANVESLSRSQRASAAPRSLGRTSMNVRVSRKDSREYLRLHQLEPYFEDAARQALVQGDRPAERLRAYFRRVLAMRQVVGREYAYVSATAWNRRSFVVVFREAIQNLLGEHLTVGDFHQLLQLVCPDFPRATLDAIVHVLPRALINDGLASCATLAIAKQVLAGRLHGGLEHAVADGAEQVPAHVGAVHEAAQLPAHGGCPASVVATAR